MGGIRRGYIQRSHARVQGHERHRPRRGDPEDFLVDVGWDAIGLHGVRRDEQSVYKAAGYGVSRADRGKRETKGTTGYG